MLFTLHVNLCKSLQFYFLFTVPAEPISFTKIAFDKGEYELSWKPPANVADRSKIENYTIFWCNHERDRPYQCTVRFSLLYHLDITKNIMKI